MILTKKKKRILIFFIYVYLILGAILIWLIFFTSGLGIVERTFFEQTGKRLFFKNTSNNPIHDITISILKENGEKIRLMHVPLALPGEEREIELEGIVGFEEAILIAEAPFHTPFTKLFILAAEKSSLNYRLNFPSIIFKDSSFQFEFQACDELLVLGNVRKVDVSTVVDKEFFPSGDETRQLIVPPQGCTSEHYILTPKKTGQSTIYFNIEIEDNKDRLSKTIEVVE